MKETKQIKTRSLKCFYFPLFFLFLVSFSFVIYFFLSPFFFFLSFLPPFFLRFVSHLHCAMFSNGVICRSLGEIAVTGSMAEDCISELPSLEQLPRMPGIQYFSCLRNKTVRLKPMASGKIYRQTSYTLNVLNYKLDFKRVEQISSKKYFQEFQRRLIAVFII